MLAIKYYPSSDVLTKNDKTKQELIDRTSGALKQASQQQRLNDSIIQKFLNFIKPNSHETNSNALSSTKAYLGTLSITIHIEIDFYNTFYPYAQTSKYYMQQNKIVEFKGKIEKTLYDCQHNSNEILSIQSQSEGLKLKISLKYFRRDGTFKRQASKLNLAVCEKRIEKLLAVPNGLINDIARIIVECVQMVEHNHLTETGIYRVCCVALELKKLRQEFNKNSYRAEETLAKQNVHVVDNLLKLFFRELPKPLFRSTLYKQFFNTIRSTDIDKQRVMLLKTFQLLYTVNQKNLFYLFDHLVCVSQQEREIEPMIINGYIKEESFTSESSN